MIVPRGIVPFFILGIVVAAVNLQGNVGGGTAFYGIISRHSESLAVVPQSVALFAITCEWAPSKMSQRLKQGSHPNVEGVGCNGVRL
jgi:hypothetical protein